MTHKQRSREIDHTDSDRRFDEQFKCIQGDCDGTGCIPNQVAEDEWEAQQCQFHAEYLIPFKQFLHQERERAYEDGQLETAAEMCKILVTTDWKNNSASGVDALSKLADVSPTGEEKM